MISRDPETLARVRAFLLARGVPAPDVDRAAADERLHLLVIDTILLPAEPIYTIGEISALSGMALEDTKRFWRALGFPDLGEDERVFTELDLEAITTVQGLLLLRMTDIEEAVQLARVIGFSMARIAEAEITASPVLRGDRDTASMAELFALTADATLPSIARLLEYAWRRHLQAAARRAMLSGAPDAPAGHVELTVGFADLVGFTALSQELSDEALAEVVARFEALAHDTVTPIGGRVVKMIGDEVMFVVEDVAKAAQIALSLSEAYADDELLSDVRVGLACGGVLARDGDYYGPVVNLASRIVNIANPGAVLVSEEVHAALENEEGLVWKPLRPRSLKDLGRVHLWRLERAGEEGEGREPAGRSRRAQARRRRRPGVLLGPEGLRERAERLRERAAAELPALPAAVVRRRPREPS